MTERLTPLQRLRELHSTGQLAVHYDQVAALLAELTDDPGREQSALSRDLSRCGRLLAGIPADQILANHPDTPQVTVALTGHSTTAALADPLTAELARHGLLARLVPGEHGAYFRDLTDPHSELACAGADLTLCLLDPDVILSELPTPWDAEDVAAACDRVLRRLRTLAEAHAAHGSGTLVLNTVPLLRTTSHQLVDHPGRALLGAHWREFNAALLRLAAEHPGLAAIDLDPLIAETGPATDPRLALYARSPYTEHLCAAYAREAAHLLRVHRGSTRKCLVLDLDHTLWSGILADDGPEGISAAHTLQGEPFAVFQRTLAQLASQGVLLAVSSKNDDAPVREVLRHHPDMTLREKDFVRINANWHPKDGNLREIAAALNLGTDALVFADDSAGERALVRHSLSETAVVPLDNEPALHRTRLLTDGWFDTPHLTADDRARTARYRAAQKRETLRTDSGTHEEYLRDLGTVVTLAPPRPFEIPRLAQLALRTNHFNLTGERTSAARMPRLLADADHLVLAVHVRDRFGDSGLVGALLGHRPDPDTLHLTQMFLSCRVLARGIEQACLAVVLAEAKASGCTSVEARYRETAKNTRAKDYYPSLGFTPVAGTADHPDGTHPYHYFTHALRDLPPVPRHVTARLCVLPEEESDATARQNP